MNCDRFQTGSQRLEIDARGIYPREEVDDHYSGIDEYCKGDAVASDLAIAPQKKNEGGDEPNTDLRTDESVVANLEQFRHQQIRFTGYAASNPNQRQQGVKQIEDE